MARQAEAYQPSAEQAELIRRYLAGDRSQEVIDALNNAAMRDSRFMKFFKQLQSQMNVRVGRGNTWSVGTNGSRVSGPNDNSEIGNYTRGASQWSQRRNERAGYNGNPTSPGGFKASGRDDDSALRRSGTVTSNAIRSKVDIDFDNGTVTVGNKKYTKAQADSILKRGMSGATMNWADQAVYDEVIKYGSSMDQAKKTRMEEMRKSATDSEERERLRLEDENRAFLKKVEADAEDLKKRERDVADANAKKQFEYELGQEERDRKAREDELKWKLDKKNGGGFRYTDEQKQKYDELSRMIADAQSGTDPEGGFLNTKDTDENGLTEQDRVISRLRKLQDDIKYNPMQFLVPEESLEDSIRNRTDEWGRVWSSDRDKIVYNPKDYEAENKAYEREEARKYHEQERRDKFIDARAAEYTKDHKEKDDTGVDVTIKGLPYDQALEQAKKDAAIRFAEEVPVSENFIAEEPIVEEPVVEEQIIAQPTETGNAGSWREFFRKPSVETFTDNSGAEQAVEKCPVCGADLDGWGNCPVCGYPDENLVAMWKQENGQEA